MPEEAQKTPFTFVDADPGRPATVQARPRGSQAEFLTRAYERPAILHDFELELAGRELPDPRALLEAAAGPPCEARVVSALRIYHVGDAARLLVVGDPRRRCDCTLEILHLGQLVAQRRLVLDPGELRVLEQPLEMEGDWQVRLLGDDRGGERRTVSCARFQALPHQVGTLNLRLAGLSVEAGEMRFELRCERLGEPVVEPLRHTLLCHGCDREVEPRRPRTVRPKERKIRLGRLLDLSAWQRPSFEAYLDLQQRHGRLDDETRRRLLRGFHTPADAAALLPVSAIVPAVLALVRPQELERALVGLGPEAIAALLLEGISALDVNLRRALSRHREALVEGELAWLRRAPAERRAALRELALERICRDWSNRLAVEGEDGHLARRLTPQSHESQIEPSGDRHRARLLLCGHRGPFTLVVTTRQGECAAVALPESETEQPCSYVADADLLRRHFRLVEGGEDWVRIAPAQAMSALCLLAVDGQGRWTSARYEDVSPGDSLPLSLPAPESRVFAAGITEQGRQAVEEDLGAALAPPLEMGLVCPAEAEPGGAVEILLQSREPAQVYLTVVDERVDPLADEAADPPPAAGSFEVTAPAPSVSRPRLRRRHETIAHAGLYTVAGTRRVRVVLGDQVAHWKVVALAFSGRQFAHRRARIRAVPTEFVELDVPAQMGASDVCEGRVYFRLQRPARLRLRGCGAGLSEEVSGSGLRTITLTESGELRGVLLRDGRVLDAVARTVSSAGLVTRRVSRFRPLATGRSYAGDPVIVYPSAAPLLAGLVREVSARGPERSETAAVRLGALGWLLKSLETASPEGAADVRLERLRGRIVEELGTLAGFRAGPIFARWPGERVGHPVATVEVLRQVWPLFGRGFADLDGWVASSLSALHGAGLRDNRLARYDAAFVDAGRLQQPARLGPEEITALQDAGIGEARLWRATLVALARGSGPQAHWRSELAWSSSGVEPTCHAVLGLLAAGAAGRVGSSGDSDLAARGLRFVFQRLDPGALAPHDALACIELLVRLGGGVGPRLRLDGREERPLRPAVARRVELLEEGVIWLRKDRSVTEDPYARPGAQRLWARLSPGILRPGQRATLSILGWPRGLKSPVLRVHLPGHLSVLKGGAFGQVVHRPLREERAQLELLAIRRGRGALRIMVYDQHDQDKLAVHDGLRVVVS